MTQVEIALPSHLKALAGVTGHVTVQVPDAPTIGQVLDALEQRYPVLRGTIRDHGTHRRRAFMRYFACEEDLSLESPETRLPGPVAEGREAFRVVGAIAGG